MLVSIGAYALLWGWQFAVGFVLLLLVHELGHVLEAKRQGLPVSAPMFIPFLGALITLKQLPDNAWTEAKVAIAGPILGGARRCGDLGARRGLDSELLVALAFTGFFLNLFNLAPLRRSTAAGSSPRSIRRSGSSGSLALRRAHDRGAEPDPDPDPDRRRPRVLAPVAAPARPRGEAYYRVTSAQRWVAGISYIVLAALLTLGMSATFVERDI